MIILHSLLFFLLFMLIHEGGHIIAAKMMAIPIQKVGASLKPYPHFYVSVTWPRSIIQKYTYLFAGMAISWLIFSIVQINDYWGIKSLYYGLIIQLIVEMNPFHSDIIIAIVTNRKGFKKAGLNNFESVYKKELAAYHFSALWYLHFSLWMFVIVLLLKMT
ncbi:hypothetical protein EO244_03195 [Ancylomarina salipaludis]|uniref:Peptidase M50 domain-containing protein n=1 Tax=Ancylomarina salipaludis TaxID=2501299 RepID=A0A4Q1JQA5_9BACT|nr:hypothetical protein [Ancylomarina salipaludis]RXQ96646.1 hypothetical protein EO244_03195 [Ancylomarina salipaludis]